MRAVLLKLLILLGIAPCVMTGQGSLATNSPGGAALSVRVVDYAIDARVDMEHKRLDATETLAYKNLTGVALTRFPFHLYLNAFRAESTFTSETHFGGGIRDNEAGNEYPAKKVGGITISRLEAEGMDVTSRLHYTAPDDGNAQDHTVAEVELPQAVQPGQTVTFRITFQDVFPESVARNGYKRDFLMGGQWYPKLGVFWHGAWNCHQYHATTEFFSDFGTFKVRLTLPRRYTVGASGVPTGVQANDDGTRTLTFLGEDIHDFAFAASPNFTVTDGTYLSAIGPVEVHVLALKAHPGAGERYLKILLGSLGEFERRYGVYPYKRITVIDPEPDSEMGGMEYPTLVTGDTLVWDPTHVTEITAEHEFGHQYWYGMVATNEFEDAWLDEGINSYTEVKVLGSLLGRETSAFGRPWANASDSALQYGEYAQETTYDPVVRHAWQFRDAASYGGVTYGKTATLLATLEGMIGTETMDEAMRTYFTRFRFTHPTTEDFLKTIEEVAIRRGRAQGFSAVATSVANLNQYHVVLETSDTGIAGLLRGLPQSATPLVTVGSTLRPFFNQAVYGTAVLDYAVEGVGSGPVEWWRPAKEQKVFRSTVTVHRLGDFYQPVTLEVRFDDGTRVRETWAQGPSLDPTVNDRWKTFTYVRGARIVSAEVDPDHVVLLDRDRLNNSYAEKANGVPAGKLATIFASGLQLVSQMAGYLI